MHKLRNITGAAAVSTALLFAVSAPVFADHGSSSTSGSGSSESQVANTAATTSATTTTEHSMEVATATTSGRQQVQEDKQQLEADKLKLQEEQKTKQTEKKSAEKQKSCETRKPGLEVKFTHIATNSKNVEGRIDAILAKAETYQANKDVLTAENFATLDGAAKDASNTAAAAVAALSTPPTLDCTSNSAASEVAVFKGEAKTARDSLKAYRQAVLALLHAEEQAKDAAKTSTSTGGTN